jgi:processing peptidase subunit beta
VSAAGDVDHDEVVDKVKELFTGFSTDPTTADQLVEANPAVFTGSEVCFLVYLDVTVVIY